MAGVHQQPEQSNFLTEGQNLISNFVGQELHEVNYKPILEN